MSSCFIERINEEPQMTTIAQWRNIGTTAATMWPEDNGYRRIM